MSKKTRKIVKENNAMLKVICEKLEIPVEAQGKSIGGGGIPKPTK